MHLHEMLPTLEVPYTLEGAYMLHHYYSVDWPAWYQLDRGRQQALLAEAAEVLEDLFSRPEGKGGGACFQVPGFKADLGLLHMRATLEELVAVEHRLAALGLHALLRPQFSYLSVVELAFHGPHERHGEILRQLGLEPGSPDWEEAMAAAMDSEKERLQAKLFPELPETRYHCFHPMSRREGETFNWYSLTSQERESTIRTHTRPVHQDSDWVTRILTASCGLDDHEWGVDLFADDCAHFKRLFYEMRLEEATARPAELGRLMLGVRTSPDRLLAEPTR